MDKKKEIMHVNKETKYYLYAQKLTHRQEKEVASAIVKQYRKLQSVDIVSVGVRVLKENYSLDLLAIGKEGRRGRIKGQVYANVRKW